MDAVLDMVARYRPQTDRDYDMALKQVIQEIALLGLWRGKFFENAAFYGGTALRIFYGLDRFSEDLDFSLLKKKDDFRLSSYFSFLLNELESFGFEVDIQSQEKRTLSDIDTAFIKAGTALHLIKIGVPVQITGKIPASAAMKIKIEIDKDPPLGFNTETKFALEPVPFSVRLFDPSSLFAGKMHAVLCRKWKNRVKGRDWYDLVWFVRKGISLDLYHLQKRMEQSGHLETGTVLTPELFSKIFAERITSVDFLQARQDVVPFIKDSSLLDLWSPDFFISVAEKIVIA